MNAIKPRDLRIGNSIYRQFSRDDKELSTITGYDFWHSEKLNETNHLVEWQSLSPIPITEEWLVKLGFVNNELGRLWLYKGQWYLCPEDAPTENQCIPIKIEYVHQVQNWHYLLTGEELTLKM